MNIGIVADPLNSPDWPQIKAFLEPAAKRGGVPVLDKHEVVWAADEGGQIYGAATARILPSEKIGEVVLVGGRERERWLQDLSDMLAVWLKLEGMRAMRAYGRKGWKRDLEAMGWKVIAEQEKVVAYERAL